MMDAKQELQFQLRLQLQRLQQRQLQWQQNFVLTPIPPINFLTNNQATISSLSQFH